MAMSTGSGGGAMADINVTPMVDVMLVLLIIFMLVTPTLVSGFQAELPQGVNLSERPEEEGRLVLGVDRAGQFYLNQLQLERAELVERLTAELEARPTDKVVYLKADRGIQYQYVMDAMAMARDSGARVMAAITEPAVDTP